MKNATGAFEQKAGVGTVDLVVIVVYFLLCLGVGIWVSQSFSCISIRMIMCVKRYNLRENIKICSYDFYDFPGGGSRLV